MGRCNHLRGLGWLRVGYLIAGDVRVALVGLGCFGGRMKKTILFGMALVGEATLVSRLAVLCGVGYVG